MTITAFYKDRKGAGCMRNIKSLAEAKKILKGGYGATDVTLKTNTGEIVGRRSKATFLQSEKEKYDWWYHPKSIEESLLPEEVSDE